MIFWANQKILIENIKDSGLKSAATSWFWKTSDCSMEAERQEFFKKSTCLYSNTQKKLSVPPYQISSVLSW